MVEVTLPFCCLNEVGIVSRIIRELDRGFFELTDCKCGKRSVVFQRVCEVFGDGLDVVVECGCRRGGSRVVKNNVFEALRGCCKCWFLWSEGAAGKTLLSTFDLGFLVSLRGGRGLGGSHPILGVKVTRPD